MLRKTPSSSKRSIREHLSNEWVDNLCIHRLAGVSCFVFVVKWSKLYFILHMHSSHEEWALMSREDFLGYEAQFLQNPSVPLHLHFFSFGRWFYAKWEAWRDLERISSTYLLQEPREHLYSFTFMQLPNQPIMWWQYNA